MPAYDFACSECGHVFETRMSMSEYSAGKRPECPGCGSPRVERSFTSVTVLTASRGGGPGGGSSARNGPGGCGASGFT